MSMKIYGKEISVGNLALMIEEAVGKAHSLTHKFLNP